MFLSVLSGAVVALALVAQATAFDEGFMTFALLILPVVLFVGVATFLRLVAINHEDVRWVVGMNLLRRAYLDAAPELRDYFVSGSHDDEAGVMATYGATPGPGSFAHEFVTTPGMLAVVDGVIAGILVSIVALQGGTGTTLAVSLGVAGSIATCALLVIYQYRGVVKPRGQRTARFPQDESSTDRPIWKACTTQGSINPGCHRGRQAHRCAHATAGQAGAGRDCFPTVGA